MFTDDASCQETPFEEPMRGRDAIYADWSTAARTQFDAMHCTLERKSGGRVEIDGILVLDLNDDGRCRKFNEWWHIRAIQMSASA